MPSFHRSALLWILLLAAGCSEPDDSDRIERRCERARDHLVELQLDTAPGVDRAAHREAMRAALGADFVARCAGALTDAQLDCVLAAHDPARAAECTAGGAP
jgi:hypothetical protein